MASTSLDHARAPARAAAPGRRHRLASFPPVLATNPYQRLLYAQLARHGLDVVNDTSFTLAWLLRHVRRVQILHFHWPQSYWRRDGRASALAYAKVAAFVLRLAAARALGYRIVWTIHQVRPHESTNPRIDLLGSRALARFAHILLAHDGATAAAARSVLGGAAHVVPHGSYLGVYPTGRSRAEVRRMLGAGPEDFVFLSLGDFRRYKSLDVLLGAFSSVRGGILVVAGAPREAAQLAELERAAASDPRVRLLPGFVPAESVAELYGAADAAIVARSDGGTSGSLILALSMETPVVAASTDVVEELISGEDVGWLFKPGDPESLAGALTEALVSDEDAVTRKRAAARRTAERLDWDEIGALTASLLLGRGAT